MQPKLLALLMATASCFAPSLSGQPPAAPKTIHVLATLSVKTGIPREQVMKVMPAEIRATVQLYLDGKIQQWYSRGDGKGVVFLLDCQTVDEAKSLMDSLPLSKENLVSFEYMALGPL